MYHEHKIQDYLTAGDKSVFGVFGTFDARQKLLAHFNKSRLAPGLGEPQSMADRLENERILCVEEEFITQSRAQVTHLLKDVPNKPRDFLAWFEELSLSGPGQGDNLFPWLATNASFEQMRWFLTQEAAGEAGFDDLVAMTQVKMPVRAKLEMARNYWDEMGRGRERGMHGPMLDRITAFFDIGNNALEDIVPEALALGNMMVALASNRRFAFHAVGALGVIEMTAPWRAKRVADGLDRLGVPKKQSQYFRLHGVLDVRHSETWNREVLAPLVEQNPKCARAIAEGAVLRLTCGAKCFARYKQQFRIN